MGRVTMWSVLAVVAILTCHLSLGQDVLSGDTLHSLGHNETSEDIQLPEHKYSCPEHYKRLPKVDSWHTCGDFCGSPLYPYCKFWSWESPWLPSPSPTPNWHNCCLFHNAGDDGLVDS